MVHSHEYLTYPSHAYENFPRKPCHLHFLIRSYFPDKVRLRLISSRPLLKQVTIALISVVPSLSTYPSVIASAGVALSAARELATALVPHGPKAGVFALCRPPGHHAGASFCGGYCFVNNVAIAARYLQSLCPESTEKHPIAILDIDYHHGNGTQENFYSDPSVLYASLHAEGDYTYYTGAVTEKGIGEGVNTNFNYPLLLDTQDIDWKTLITPFISLGVDTFADDPMSTFKISRSCYTIIGQMIADLGKLALVVMEGGYLLGGNVRAMLHGFEQRGREEEDI